jgi:hypothetical protein
VSATDELLAELRHNANEIGVHWSLRPILDDAAREIEQFRDAKRDIVDALTYMDSGHYDEAAEVLAKWAS